jgi:hypothetical protein
VFASATFSLSLDDVVLGVNNSSVFRVRANHLLRLQAVEPVRLLIALVLAAMYRWWCVVLTLILVVGIIVVVIIFMFNRSQFHLAQNMVFQCQSLSYVTAHATFLGQ